MPWRHDGSGMGGGPIPEKTQGWLWGFLWGAATVLIAGAVWWAYGWVVVNNA